MSGNHTITCMPNMGYNLCDCEPGRLTRGSALVIPQPKGINDLIERQRQRLHETMHADAVAFRQLREIMGFVQNGSNVVVMLSQDECTKDYAVSVGDDLLKAKRYYAPVLHEAIAKAYEVHKQGFET